MSLYSILLLVMSLAPGVLSLYAARSLWRSKDVLPGSLYPILFCVANGIYSIAFSVMIVISSFHLTSREEILVLYWLAFYMVQQVTCVTMALFFTGKISDKPIRKFLRMKNSQGE